MRISDRSMVRIDRLLRRDCLFRAGASYLAPNNRENGDSSLPVRKDGCPAGGFPQEWKCTVECGCDCTGDRYVRCAGQCSAATGRRGVDGGSARVSGGLFLVAASGGEPSAVGKPAGNGSGGRLR